MSENLISLYKKTNPDMSESMIWTSYSRLHHGDHDPGLGLGGNNDDDGVHLNKFSAALSFRYENLPVEIYCSPPVASAVDDSESNPCYRAGLGGESPRRGSHAGHGGHLVGAIVL